MSAADRGPLQRFERSGSTDLLELHARYPDRYPFLLESAANHAQAGRYDILFAFPAQAISASGDAHTIRGFFDTLDRDSAGATTEAVDGVPFVGGWFLLLGYEAVRGVEAHLAQPVSPYQLPDALAVRCTAAIIFDRLRNCSLLIAESDSAQLRQMLADCELIQSARQQETVEDDLLAGVEEDEPSRFLEGVARIHDYLRSGDTFQVNLSRGWRGVLRAGKGYLDVYRGLRKANPAPFAGLARWGGSAVLSSSPERLLSIEHGVAQTRPIAGTHARLTNACEDEVQRSRLIASLKERAEHVMLIDLERNDLGRVCTTGSVAVSELMAIESYSHVHHIVSNVRGRLRSDVGPGTAIRAVFPGGTITGCPKVRAMQIIAELEGEGRGPYTGAMGYLSRCGRLDTNILIRTLICEGQRVAFRAGAGIVADSNATSELAETRAKARGLLLALGAAAA